MKVQPYFPRSLAQRCRGELGDDPRRHAVRVAVCASDQAIGEQIAGLLTTAGYELVEIGSSLENLILSASHTDPQLVVLQSRSRPSHPPARSGCSRARLDGVPLVIVATGEVRRAAQKLVLAQADGLVNQANLEQALDGDDRMWCSASQLCMPASLRETLAQPVFSHREKQVLELVLDGLTNGEIAARLYLSESTVKSHLASSFRKLRVSSRTEAAKRLAELGSEAAALGHRSEPPPPRPPPRSCCEPADRCRDAGPGDGRRHRLARPPGRRSTGSFAEPQHSARC